MSLGFQTFDQMIFGRSNFPGIRWYVVTLQDQQMVWIRKSLGTTVSEVRAGKSTVSDVS